MTTARHPRLFRPAPAHGAGADAQLHPGGAAPGRVQGVGEHAHRRARAGGGRAAGAAHHAVGRPDRGRPAAGGRNAGGVHPHRAELFRHQGPGRHAARPRSRHGAGGAGPPAHRADAGGVPAGLSRTSGSSSTSPTGSSTSRRRASTSRSATPRRRPTPTWPGVLCELALAAGGEQPTTCAARHAGPSVGAGGARLPAVPARRGAGQSWSFEREGGPQGAERVSRAGERALARQQQRGAARGRAGRPRHRPAAGFHRRRAPGRRASWCTCCRNGSRAAFSASGCIAIRPWSPQVPRAVQCLVDHLGESSLGQGSVAGRGRAARFRRRLAQPLYVAMGSRSAQRGTARAPQLAVTAARGTRPASTAGSAPCPCPADRCAATPCRRRRARACTGSSWRGCRARRSASPCLAPGAPASALTRASVSCSRSTRQPLRPARDDADVGGVALVAAAAPGQADQRHLDHGPRRRASVGTARRRAGGGTGAWPVGTATAAAPPPNTTCAA